MWAYSNDMGQASSETDDHYGPPCDFAISSAEQINFEALKMQAERRVLCAVRECVIACVCVERYA